MNPHKLLGFNGGTGTLVARFGVQGTGVYPELQFGNIADTSWAQNGSTVFIADGDMGINNRVSRLDAIGDGKDSGKWSTTWVVGNNATPGSDPNHWCSPGGPGNPYNASSAWNNCNFSAPHSIAYDECWNKVYIADRDHQRVVALDSTTGEQYDNHWGLEDLLGPYYRNVSDPSMMRVWSVRAAMTMSKNHTGQLFVGLGSYASPAAPGYIAVLDLEEWDRPCDAESTAATYRKQYHPRKKQLAMPLPRLRTVIEIGRRFPHEITVDSVNGLVYSAAIDLIDPAVAPGIGALTRYRRRGH
jgi:hypothetical protein